MTKNAGKKLTHPEQEATIGIVKIAKEVAYMIRSGLILMIRQEAQSGQSAYAIGKKLGISCIVHNKTTQNCKRKSPLLQS